MKYRKGWTTHIPMLVKAVQSTTGGVLELGSGPFSTPLLHWLCAEANRPLHTYEASKEYFKRASEFKSRKHRIHFVEDWDKIDFGNGWDVALIDNELERRSIDPIRLKDAVKYLVLHDTNAKGYGYEKVFPHFKYVHHWKFCRPWTSVVSNFNNLFEDKKIFQILTEYATDKNLFHKKGHCYGYAYEDLFSKFDRYAKLDILEVGTEYGESLLAWREFFPNANITGVDIEDKVENKHPNINYLVKDVKAIKNPKQEYDIVIDDGSHKLFDVVHTVKHFKLKAGGIMVIEDCQAPDHWYKEIKKHTNYAIEQIDMRKVNGQHDDFMIVLRNYGYYQ